MNEHTTVDNIIKAFQLRLGDGYFLSFDAINSMYQLVDNVTSRLILRFSYNSDIRTFDYCNVIDDTFLEQSKTIFTQFKDLKTCQKIVNALFEHDISKIILKDPIILDPSSIDGHKVMGSRITFKQPFYYKNAWNMIFIGMAYVITPEFEIKPVIDMTINFRGFGKLRLLIDEYTGDVSVIFNETDYTLNNPIPALSDIVGKRYSFTANMKSNIIDDHFESGDSLQTYMDDFMIKLSNNLYRFYINEFRLVPIAESTGSVDDFKILEMLKV